MLQVVIKLSVDILRLQKKKPTQSQKTPTIIIRQSSIPQATSPFVSV